MDPAAEGEVAVDVAVEADVERIRVLLGVDVGRRQVGHHEVTGADRVFADAVILARPADDGGHRRFPAEQFLDCVGDHLWMLDELALVIRMLREERPEARQRIRDRVQSRGEQNEADVEHLVAREVLVAGFDSGEQREDVVARRGGAFVQHRVEVRVDPLRRLLLDARPFLGQRLRGARSEDPVAERDQRVELFPVEPHHPEEHRRREQLGELRGEVACAAFDEAIDEVVDPHRDVALEPIDLTGREERIEQPAVAKVIRRVDGQRDERPIVALIDEVGRREDLRVPQRLLDERAAARDEQVAQRKRARLGQLVVVGLGRRRVGHHFGLQVDEVDPSDGTVRTLRCRAHVGIHKMVSTILWGRGS